MPCECPKAHPSQDAGQQAMCCVWKTAPSCLLRVYSALPYCSVPTVHHKHRCRVLTGPHSMPYCIHNALGPHASALSVHCRQAIGRRARSRRRCLRNATPCVCGLCQRDSNATALARARNSILCTTNNADHAATCMPTPQTRRTDPDPVPAPITF